MSSSSSDPPTTALAAAQSRFAARNPRSAALHASALACLPGGNTRTTLFTAPFPVYMASGHGHALTSEDGQVYTDLVGELSAGLYGHSHPAIRAALQAAVSAVGLNLGAHTVHETALARAVCARFGLDRVRFANSGTEANLHALGAARRFTGRRRVVVFGGGYHGSAFMFGGGGPAANNVDLADWVVVERYNDLEAARAAIKGDGVAAVLVEGMQGGAGAIPGRKEFLTGVQDACREAGVLFIMDEVMTSRLAPGGLASIHGLEPDLKTFGKWLGGGLAFGAFGGRADVMAAFDPREPGALSHGGTFNNNALTMYVGHAGLTQVYTPEVCVDFNKSGDMLRQRLAEVTRGTKLCFTGVGSLLASHFTEDGRQTLERETQEDGALKDLFWYEMMEDGFWLVRRGNISLVLGTAQEELDRFVGCVQAFLARHGDLVKVSAT